MRPRPIIAGVAALALIGAASPPPAPAGTAETSMTALEISVSGLGDLLDGLTVLDIASFASTDTDSVRNAAGSPFASIGVIPAAVGGEQIGAITARSDGDTSQSTGGHSQAIGPVDLSVDGMSLSASADASSAAALVEALGAQFSILENAIGSAVTNTGVSSTVDKTSATATQGLTSSGLQIDLGDLVDVDALPLDVVLSLAGELTGLISGNLEGLLETVSTLYKDLREHLAGMNTDLGSAAALTAELEASLEELESLEEELETLDDLLGEAETLLDLGGTEEQITDLEDKAKDLLEGVLGDGGGLLGLSVSALALDDLISDLEGAIADVESEIADLSAEIDGLVSEIVTILDRLLVDVLNLDGLVDSLIAAIGDLLAQLPDALDAIANADLVDIGEVTAGITAYATGDGGDAVLGCSAEHVRIAGIGLGSPTCDAPLTEVSQQLGTAIGQLKSVLGALPIVGDVVPDVTLRVFSDAHRTVEEVDGYWKASAGVNLFEFDLPSIELGAVTDGLLEQIADASLSSLLDALLDLLNDQVDLVAEFSDVTDALSDLAGELDGAITTVASQLDVIVDLEALVSGLLDGLPAVDTLDGLATPGLKIVVDPTSTAEFRAGATPPADTPPLPVTGGGFAILGLVAMAGAAGMLRRRR
jgi:prefoldin subunit 5